MAKRETAARPFLQVREDRHPVDEKSTTSPRRRSRRTWPGSFVADLKEAGLETRSWTTSAYVMATMPSNIPAGHRRTARSDDRLFGPHGHYHEVRARAQPQVIRNYNGKDIILPGDSDHPAASTKGDARACKG